MTTRRKPTGAPINGSVPLTTTMPGSTIPLPTSSSTRSPLLPTRLEALLIAIYPTTLLLGSIFSTLSPTTRSTPYSPITQSHPPESAPSYFAHKKNAFNVYFVKVGWFWTSLAFGIFWVMHPGFGGAGGWLSRKRIQALARYTVVTGWWVLVTQWCFGPGLIDRGFRFTGGKCADILRQDNSDSSDVGAKELVSAAACKAVGGVWKGGHDISGHVFLLILGSALLWLEFLPALTRVEGLRDGRLITLPVGRVASVAVEKEQGNKAEGVATTKGVKFAIGVAALMWWMLLMTAAYFHTWFEKFTGLAVAFGGLWGVYFAPRGLPGLRAVLGMPGV